MRSDITYLQFLQVGGGLRYYNVALYPTGNFSVCMSEIDRGGRGREWREGGRENNFSAMLYLSGRGSEEYGQ